MTRFDRIAFAAVVCIVCSSSALPADVRITENTSAKAGDRSVQGVRSIYIRGSRMRIELTQNNRTTATVFDLPAGAIVDLEPEKKRAEIREIGARNARDITETCDLGITFKCFRALQVGVKLIPFD